MSPDDFWSRLKSLGVTRQQPISANNWLCCTRDGMLITVTVPDRMTIEERAAYLDRLIVMHALTQCH